MNYSCICDLSPIFSAPQSLYMKNTVLKEYFLWHFVILIALKLQIPYHLFFSAK